MTTGHSACLIGQQETGLYLLTEPVPKGMVLKRTHVNPLARTACKLRYHPTMVLLVDGLSNAICYTSAAGCFQHHICNAILFQVYVHMAILPICFGHDSIIALPHICCKRVCHCASHRRALQNERHVAASKFFECESIQGTLLALREPENFSCDQCMSQIFCSTYPRMQHCWRTARVIWCSVCL